MRDRICEPNRRLQFLACHPRAFGGIAPRKSSNLDQKWLLPHYNAKYHVEYMLYICLYFTGEQNWPNIAQWSQITLNLSNSRDGWVFSLSTKFNYDRVALWKVPVGARGHFVCACAGEIGIKNSSRHFVASSSLRGVSTDWSTLENRFHQK